VAADRATRKEDAMKHGLTRQTRDPNGYGDGLDDRWVCECGRKFDYTDLEEAFAHGREAVRTLNRGEVYDEVAKIVSRAEYAGRQQGVAIKTRSNREAKNAYEAHDVSMREAFRMAADLAEKVAP
jgi:hypothetical protein